MEVTNSPTDEEIYAFLEWCNEKEEHEERMQRFYIDLERERIRKQLNAEKLKERILKGPPPIKRKQIREKCQPSVTLDHPIFKLLSFERTNEEMPPAAKRRRISTD
jgi:hypothetical protein